MSAPTTMLVFIPLTSANATDGRRSCRQPKWRLTPAAWTRMC